MANPAFSVPGRTRHASQRRTLAVCTLALSVGLPSSNHTASAARAPQPVLAAVSVEPEHGRNQWRYIVIHHSASRDGNAKSIDRFHRGRGWDGLAYHFVIDNGKGGPDGYLEVSPRWWSQKHGAHAGTLRNPADPAEVNCYNEFGIGICLVGNLEKQGPTAAQLRTLSQLVSALKEEYAIPNDAILGHRHVKDTSCPGRKFPWGALFAMMKQPHPKHLYKHAATGTLDRCPWCLVQDTTVPGPPPSVPQPAPATPPAGTAMPR